jgi:multiple sugar transport system permease protein
MMIKASLWKRRGSAQGSLLLRIPAFLLVFIVGVSMIVPFYWMLSSSLKTNQQVWLIPPVWIPNPIEWKNYALLLKAAPNVPRYFLNSALVSSVTTLGSLFFNTLAGYGFAKYQFRGRDAIFALLLATMMIPFQTTMIPVFIFIKMLGWVDTYTGLIVPGLAGAFGVFLMRQFFLSIPNDLIDSGRIDGASEFRILVQIVLPLTRPALSALAIFTFLGTWNDFIWPVIVVKRDEMFTLPLFVSSLSKGIYVMNWPLLMAGGSVVIFPVIIVFLLLQRQFIEGIALTGIKG